MSISPAIFIEIKDASGNPVSGGKLNTYAEGTSTPKATYSDSALSTANANPIVAGADGLIGPIYMTAGEGYKFVETDADDNTLRTEDGVYSVQSTSSSLITRVKQIASNPLDYGAVGDGAADESSEVQSAIDNASGVVDLLGLTFRCDSAITLASGITLANGDLDFSNCNDDQYIIAHGTVGTYYNLDSNASFEDSSVALSAGDFSSMGPQAGNLLSLKSSANFSDSGSDAAGELLVVDSVSSPNITPARPIRHDYTTANTAQVAKITAVEDIALRNLTLTCSTAAGGTNTRAISLQACRRVRVHNVEVQDSEYISLFVAGCLDVTVSDMVSINTSSNETAGVFMAGACQNIAIHNYTCHGNYSNAKGMEFSNSTFSAASLGAPVGQQRDIEIVSGDIDANIGIDMRTSVVGVDLRGIRTRTSGRSVDFTGCSISASNVRSEGSAGNGDITIRSILPSVSGRGYHVYLENCRTLNGTISIAPAALSGGAGTYDSVRLVNCESSAESITVTTVSTGAPITNLVFSSCSAPNGAISVTSGTEVITSVQMSNNRAKSCDISGTATESISYVSLSNDQFIGGTAKVLDIDEVQVLSMSNVTIFGDDGTLTHGAEITNVSRVMVSGGFVDGIPAGDIGMLFTDCVNISVQGTEILSDGYGVQVAATNVGFVGCLLDGQFVGGDAEGVLISATTASRGLRLRGRVASSSDYPVNITGVLSRSGIDGLTSLRGNDSDVNVRLAGTSTDDISTLTINGCTIVNGSVGISGSNCESTCRVGPNNVFSSVSGNTVEGILVRMMYSDADIAAGDRVDGAVVGTTETEFSKSFTIPKNTLAVGSRVIVRGHFETGTVNTSPTIIKLYFDGLSGGNAIDTTVNLTADGSVYKVTTKYDLVFTTVGASGVAVGAEKTFVSDDSVETEYAATVYNGASSLNTTADAKIVFAAELGDAGDTADLREFSVEVIPPGINV